MKKWEPSIEDQAAVAEAISLVRPPSFLTSIIARDGTISHESKFGTIEEAKKWGAPFVKDGNVAMHRSLDVIAGN